MGRGRVSTCTTRPPWLRYWAAMLLTSLGHLVWARVGVRARVRVRVMVGVRVRVRVRIRVR